MCCLISLFTLLQSQAHCRCATRTSSTDVNACMVCPPFFLCVCVCVCVCLLSSLLSLYLIFFLAFGSFLEFLAAPLLSLFFFFFPYPSFFPPSVSFLFSSFPPLISSPHFLLSSLPTPQTGACPLHKIGEHLSEASFYSDNCLHVTTFYFFFSFLLLFVQQAFTWANTDLYLQPSSFLSPAFLSSNPHTPSHPKQTTHTHTHTHTHKPTQLCSQIHAFSLPKGRHPSHGFNVVLTDSTAAQT